MNDQDSNTESAAPAANLRGLHRTTIVVRNDALGELARLDIKLSPVGLQLVEGIAAALAAPDDAPLAEIAS